MRFMVRFGFLLGILGALFWGDVLAFLKLAEAKDRKAGQASVEALPDPTAPRADAREAARQEYERLRRENLAAAEEEARWRARENAVADREDELEELREAYEQRESSRPSPHRGPPPRRSPGSR